MTTSRNRDPRIVALEQDIAAQEGQARARRELAEISARADEDERELVKELHSLGYMVPSIDNLVNSKIDYSSAFPTIIKWLPKVKVIGVRDMLVRSLAAPKYWRVVAPALIEFFKSDISEEGAVRSSVGNSLETIANDNLFDDLSELLREPRYGGHRGFIAMAMGKMRKRRADAIKVLLPLLDDPTIDGDVLYALRRLKALEAEPYIGRFLTDESRWKRKEAEKFLAVINAAKQARPA